MHTYHTPLDLVRKRSPERPVAFARPDAVAVAARWFQANFKGDVFYAVKANPSPWVIETLVENGVTSFDVASIAEVELVSQFAPGARMAFMHPVKSRRAIADAYFAPVLSRARSYGLPLSSASARYAQAVWALPALQSWRNEALAEHDYLSDDEPYRERPTAR